MLDRRRVEDKRAKQIETDFFAHQHLRLQSATDVAVPFVCLLPVFC